MKGYRQKNWKEFRQEVIDLDGGICSTCGRSEPEVKLQVHHKIYVPNKLPWEYSYNNCVTLCKGCHAAEHGIIPPKFGWEYVGYDDLGDLIGNCELCGSSLRHQFFVFHPRWGTMVVGTYCCDSLTDTEVASNLIDSKKRYEDRKRRFISSARWSQQGGRYHIKQNKISVEVVNHNNEFRILMNNTLGKMHFATLEDAKKQVFEAIESGKARDYLKSKGNKP